MKMVRVGDKMVPEFAADGKGANDLKKAMYGAKIKAGYGAKVPGKKYMMGGGEVKMYEEGGPIVTRDKDSQRFRVIPAPVDPSNPDSELQAKFYVGGREVSPKEFASLLPEGTDINEMVRQGYEEARPTYNRAEKKWGYTPTKYFQAAVKERKAYEAKGEEGMRELESERDQAAAKRYQEMGGYTGKAVPGGSMSI